MEQETAETWIVQYRVKGKSQKRWGAWASQIDYQTPEPALRLVAAHRKREQEIREDTRADMEWRVLHVTQEVVY